MAHRALKVWENFDDAVGGDAGFMRTGIVWVAGPDHESEFVANAKMLQSIGIKAELLDQAAIKGIATYLVTDDVQVGIFEPEGGVADGSLACSAFAAPCRLFFEKIKQGVEVSDMQLMVIKS